MAFWFSAIVWFISILGAKPKFSYSGRCRPGRRAGGQDHFGLTRMLNCLDFGLESHFGNFLVRHFCL